MERLFLVILLASTLLSTNAAEPEVLLEVGPSETVARASEGDLAVLGDGRWILGYSEFPAKQKGRYAAHHDHAKARIVTRTSSDSGRTWSEPVVAVEPEDGDLNVMSVSFLRLRDGRLALFHIRKRAESDGRPVMRVSADEGKTWSAPRYCVDEAHRDYYVLNNARAVRLSTGRIVLPLCRHSVDAGDPQGFESEGRLCVAASDDDGQSWRMICEPFKVFDRLKARVTVQEPGIVELRDGRLLLYARTNRRAQWGLWSSDGGATWSKAEPLPLVSPNLAPATITRLTDGNLVAVWNDYSKKPSDPDRIAFAEQREPFSIAWSKDDGRTWSPSRTIEADPPEARPNLYCCYFAVREIGDSLYVFHCHHNGLKLSHLTKIPLAWVYASGEQERTDSGASPALALPELSLSCPEKGVWTFRTRRVGEGTSVGEYEVEMTASVPSAPPKFSLSFAMPQCDIGHLWSSGGFRAPVPPNWSSTSRTASSLSAGIPVYAFTDGADGNRLTVSVSEARRRVGVSFGNREEDCAAVGTLDFFSEPEAPLTNYMVRLRFDARPVFWSDAVRDGAAWVEKRQDAAPAVVPAAAREPVYSSWYGFHQQLTDRALERECARAAALGLKTVIVDDGWQTDDTSRGYPYCGDWRPAAAKFPDMRAHVARVHALGMKYLLWYGVPLVGVKSEAYGRFRGKFLYENAGMKAAALDPRFPEVRAHLSDVFARALRDWDLDGFKFDFIDAFRFDGPDPAVAEDYAGRDVKSLPEATDRLMTEVTRRLGAIKPGLLIEFRQSYVGPVVRKFGNIIRAGDCPGDFVLNRRRIADLRLTSGATAVHADMLEWHPSDTPEKAARYVLAALFSTIQYSMILGKLPPEHERMMRHYLAFTSAHRATLQEGAFRPHGLAEGYPWIEAEGPDERIAAVYAADTCVCVPADGRTAYVVNATSTGRVLVDLATAPKSVRAYDVFGTPVAVPVARAGVQSLSCPESGYVAFEFQGKRQ